MNLKEFVGRWEFAVYHLSGGKLVLYLEKGDERASLIQNGQTLSSWETVPECIGLGDDGDMLTIWPNLPEVTAWSVREEHLKILNEHNPYPGQTWIKQGESTAVPVLRRV